MRGINSRVLESFALPRAIAFEIIDHGGRIAAQVAKVNSLCSLLQQQHAIECLEELRRRLVNGAKDSLALVGKAAQERDDCPSALGVETGGGFIQEEQQFGLEGR